MRDIKRNFTISIIIKKNYDNAMSCELLPDDYMVMIYDNYMIYNHIRKFVCDI